MNALPLGKGIVRRQGVCAAILCFGTLAANARQVADELNLTLCDMRFVKPLDTGLIDQLARDHELLVTLEENAIAGGAGSAVTEYLHSQQNTIPVLQLGLTDEFVSHASQADQLASQGLNAEGIASRIRQRLCQMGLLEEPDQPAQIQP